MLAQVILVVADQFLEAGAGDVGQFEFAFLRRAGNAAAFRDVLVAAARGLTIWSWVRDFMLMKRSQKRMVAS
jgi:hypothetical protein